MIFGGFSSFIAFLDVWVLFKDYNYQFTSFRVDWFLIFCILFCVCVCVLFDCSPPCVSLNWVLTSCLSQILPVLMFGLSWDLGQTACLSYFLFCFVFSTLGFFGGGFLMKGLSFGSFYLWISHFSFVFLFLPALDTFSVGQSAVFSQCLKLLLLPSNNFVNCFSSPSCQRLSPVWTYDPLSCTQRC